MTTTVERFHQQTQTPPALDGDTPAGFCVTVGDNGRIRHAGMWTVPWEGCPPRLIPACRIGVSAAEPARVRPNMLHQIVTCRRFGCRSLASPDNRVLSAPATPEQLTLGV